MCDNNFFSIDRLVEFGMGMAVAQQMIKTMNESMTSMHIPGAMNQMEKQNNRIFYAVIDGQQSGPFLETELSRLIADRKISKETYIWMPSMRNWKLAEEIPEVLRIVALTPPPFQKDV